MVCPAASPEECPEAWVACLEGSLEVSQEECLEDKAKHMVAGKGLKWMMLIDISIYSACFIYLDYIYLILIF